MGKVVVTLEPQDQPGALSFASNELDLRASNGIFTSVQGTVEARFVLPAGYALDSQDSVTLATPLTPQLFGAASANIADNGRTLVLTFDKGLIDNNIPAGDAVPLTVSANFMHNGVQKKLTSTATVRVVK